MKERELKVNVTWQALNEWMSHDERRNCIVTVCSYTQLQFNLNSKYEHLVIIYFYYFITYFLGMMCIYKVILSIGHVTVCFSDTKLWISLLPFFLSVYSWSIMKLWTTSVSFLRQQLLLGPSDMHTDLFPNGLSDFDLPSLNLTQNEDLPLVRPCCSGHWLILEALILFWVTFTADEMTSGWNKDCVCHLTETCLLISV